MERKKSMDEPAASGSRTQNDVVDGGRFAKEFAGEQTSEKESAASAAEPPLPGVKHTSDALCYPTSQATFFPDNDPASRSCDSVLTDPTSAVISSETLELREEREELSEVKNSLHLGLLEHSSTVFDPILVISCGDNQDSEEIYFISYIYSELCLRGFTPFRYDITRSTVTGNQENLYRSRVGIMIVSKNYACSRKSIDEFVAIMDNLKANDLVLIPVFFKVNDSNIMGQIRAFTQLGNPVQASQVRKWRVAMRELISINRYHYMKGDEVKLAKNIVRDVCTNRNLKGRGLQLTSILSLLSCSQSSSPRIVGLWGMAGIGKTTIAREIFRTLAERYDVCFFLPDFHIMCQTKGLDHLHNEFFSKIFGEENVFIDACDTKLSFTRDRFSDKRVLIILDGVSNARDAEVLVGGFGWFSGGHTIILTSRNRHALVQCNAKEIYEIPKLSDSESRRLCSHFATGKNWKGRRTIFTELVNYASGNPLALRVLSSSVQEQCINDEKHLRILSQQPPIEIQEAFKGSFDKQDDNETNIFLDLACFFRGENKNRVVNILDGCGFFTDVGIYGLIDESLISLVDNRIEMPNIFQDMGRFVVCQEDEEAGKRSRLWGSDEIADVLTNKTGTEALEGIFLDASGLTLELSPNVFEMMYRLRLLKLHYPISGSHCKVSLPQGLQFLPDELRLLHWEGYPLRSLPRNFNPKNLVELNMPNSNLTKLWKGTKNLEKLKRIVLSHSLQLVKFPRLSKAMNLEHIDLEGCTSLVKVNSSILHHHKLTFLSLKDCSHLQSMPTTVHLESLEVLNLSGCSELEDLQDVSPNLKELYLAGTAIREMPSSLKDLTRLVTLDLENCERLWHLPREITNLKAMVTLKLSGCSISVSHCKVCLFRLQGLHSLPDELRLLHWERYPLISLPRNFYPTNLVELNMPYSNMTKLWEGTKNLKNLKRIVLSHSRKLTEFPWVSMAINLEHIDLEGCTSLISMNLSIIHLNKLTFVSLKDCSHLRVMPTTVHLESLEVLNLSGCSALDELPGFSPNLKELYVAGTAIKEIPSSIKDLTKLVTFDLENYSRLQHQPPEISNPEAAVTLSTERPASSMTLSSVEDMAPPYKRYRLKRVIESVILSIRKRKREKSVSSHKPGSAFTLVHDPSYKLHDFVESYSKLECQAYMKTGYCIFGNDCIFLHPGNRETHLPESTSSMASETPHLNRLRFSSSVWTSSFMSDITLDTTYPKPQTSVPRATKQVLSDDETDSASSAYMSNDEIDSDS